MKLGELYFELSLRDTGVGKGIDKLRVKAKEASTEVKALANQFRLLAISQERIKATFLEKASLTGLTGYKREIQSLNIETDNALKNIKANYANLMRTAQTQGLGGTHMKALKDQYLGTIDAVNKYKVAQLNAIEAIEKANRKPVQKAMTLREQQALLAVQKEGDSYNKSARIHKDTEEKKRNEIKKTAQAHDAALDRMMRTMQAFAGVTALIGLGAALKASIKVGIDFNRAMENARIGIAGLLIATTEYYDKQGKMATGVYAWNAAMQESFEIQKMLQIASLETSATLDQLMQGYQVASVYARQAGMDSKQAVQFISGIVKTAMAQGLTLDRLSDEIRDILSGTMETRTTQLMPFFQAAGLTNKKIKELIASGGLFNESMRAMAPAIMAARAAMDTFDTRLSNLKEALQLVLGAATKPLGDSLKKLFTELTDSLITIDAKSNKVTVNSGFVKFFSILPEIIQNAVDAIRSLNKAISDFAQAHPTIAATTGIFTEMAVEIGVAILAASGLFKILDIGGTILKKIFDNKLTRILADIIKGFLGIGKGAAAASGVIQSSMGTMSRGFIKLLPYILTLIKNFGIFRAIAASISLAFGWFTIQKSLKSTGQQLENNRGIMEELAVGWRRSSQKIGEDFDKLKKRIMFGDDPSIDNLHQRLIRNIVYYWNQATEAIEGYWDVYKNKIIPKMVQEGHFGAIPETGPLVAQTPDEQKRQDEQDKTAQSYQNTTRSLEDLEQAYLAVEAAGDKYTKIVNISYNAVNKFGTSIADLQKRIDRHVQKLSEDIPVLEAELESAKFGTTWEKEFARIDKAYKPVIKDLEDAIQRIRDNAAVTEEGGFVIRNADLAEYSRLQKELERAHYARALEMEKAGLGKVNELMDQNIDKHKLKLKWEETYLNRQAEELRSGRAAVTNLDKYAGQYADMIKYFSRLSNIPAELIAAMMKVESNFDRQAKSEAGAVGLMQLMADTAKRFKVMDREDAFENTRGGIEYLIFLLNRYKDTKKAVMAYHAGEGNMDKGIIGPKTLEYAVKVEKELAKFGMSFGSNFRIAPIVQTELDKITAAIKAKYKEIEELQKSATPDSPEIKNKIEDAYADIANYQTELDKKLREGEEQALSSQLTIMQELIHSTEITEAERLAIKDKYLKLFRAKAEQEMRDLVTAGAMTPEMQDAVKRIIEARVSSEQKALDLIPLQKKIDLADAIKQYMELAGSMQEVYQAESMLLSAQLEEKLKGITDKTGDLYKWTKILGEEQIRLAQLWASDDFFGGLMEGFREVGREMKTMSKLGEEVAKGLADSLGTFFSDLISGTKTAKEAFEDFLNSILNMFSKMLAERLVQQLFAALGSLGGGGNTGFFGGLLSAFTGGKKSPSAAAGAAGSLAEAFKNVTTMTVTAATVNVNGAVGTGVAGAAASATGAAGGCPPGGT